MQSYDNINILTLYYHNFSYDNIKYISLLCILNNLKIIIFANYYYIRNLGILTMYIVILRRSAVFIKASKILNSKNRSCACEHISFQNL